MSGTLARLEDALTSKKWQHLFYTAAECPTDLYAYFRDFLPHLDSIEERIALGGVYVNGISIADNISLKAPCKVEYYEPKFELKNIQSVYPPFDTDWIVYRDDFMAIVYKPAGLPCMATKEQKIYNLKSYLEDHFSPEIHMPSRIDTSTQGLIAVSVNPSMHNYLQKAFERKIVVKRYLMASRTETTWDVRAVKARIAKDSQHAVLRKISPDSGKTSFTVFTRLSRASDKTYFFARPLTGRTHQIRVHAKHLGIPISGDNFYGGSRDDLLNLMSYSFGVWHPFRKRFFEIEVPAKLVPRWARGVKL